MNKLNRFRLKLLLSMGYQLGKLDYIPDKYYNMLRYRYHRKIPASFFLLLDNMPGNSDFIKLLLFTQVLDEDYQIVIADTKYEKNYPYVQTETNVYDVLTGIVVDREYYEKIFSIANKEEYERDKVEEYKKAINLPDSSYCDLQNVSMDLLDDIDQQYKNYKGRRKELITRQIESYFNDIHYEDGLMFLDFDKFK